MRLIIIQILCVLGFKKAIQDYAYQHQSKEYKQHMTFAFVDSKGRKYFYFKDLKYMPLAMLEQVEELQAQIGMKIKQKDLDEWCAAMQSLLNGNSPNKITEAGYLLGALQERRQLLADPVLLMHLACTLYVREDEMMNGVYTYSEELHSEKVAQLTEDKKSGGALFDFFAQAGLTGYLPSASFTAPDFEKFCNSMTKQMAAFNNLLGEISTLRSGQSKGVKRPVAA